MSTILDGFAEHLGLGALLNELQRTVGVAEHVHHWTQGEFHHDLVLRLADTSRALPGAVLVVSTNCNGGVKELLCLDAIPDRSALWHHRCPENAEFSGTLPAVLASARTVHWFDPCNLLRSDARSELRPEFRERQPGGGWQANTCRIQCRCGQVQSEVNFEVQQSVLRFITFRWCTESSGVCGDVD